jgi:phage gpG-like protein
MATGIRINIRGARMKTARVRGAVNQRQLLTAIGAAQLSWTMKNFTAEGIEKKWAPLRPNTVASRRKGSRKPLQDTGRLRQSFTFKIRGNHAVAMGTQSKVAQFHEHGTRPYVILPKGGGKLKFMTPGGMRFAKKVNHPGLPARPMLPSVPMARMIASRVVGAAIDLAVSRG